MSNRRHLIAGRGRAANLLATAAVVKPALMRAQPAAPTARSETGRAGVARVTGFDRNHEVGRRRPAAVNAAGKNEARDVTWTQILRLTAGDAAQLWRTPLMRTLPDGDEDIGPQRSMAIAAVVRLQRVLGSGIEQEALVVRQHRHLGCGTPQDRQRSSISVEHAQPARRQVGEIGEDGVASRWPRPFRQIPANAEPGDAEHASTRDDVQATALRWARRLLTHGGDDGDERTPGRVPPGTSHGSRAVTEIGRASCRERV